MNQQARTSAAPTRVSQFVTLTGAEQYVICPLVNLEQKVNDWVDAIAARNAGSDLWTARFVIQGYWPMVGAAEDLAAVDGALAANGDGQYIVTFPPANAREAVQLVAEQGGWLCERQTPVPSEE